jgi:hypothetical protein
MKKLINKPEDVVTEAGVVLHNVDDTGSAVDLLGRLEHLVWRGRREDFTCAGWVEHAHSDEAPCIGSWPEPSHEITATLPLTGRVGP